MQRTQIIASLCKIDFLLSIIYEEVLHRVAINTLLGKCMKHPKRCFCIIIFCVLAICTGGCATSSSKGDVPAPTSTASPVGSRVSALADTEKSPAADVTVSSSSAPTSTPGMNSAESPETNPGFFTRVGDRLVSIWNAPTFDLYVTAYTWHNRLMYSESHVKRYNEYPWGGGFGRSLYDEDGDWHGLYFLGFTDSNYRFEPFAGYGYVKNWKLDEAGDWKVGLGYTAGITARGNYHYIPFPALLPLLSLEYMRLAVQMTYIPGEYNDGNVLFMWLRWHFD